MSVFSDQQKFMEASEQTVGFFNEEQFELYVRLIDEEFNDELQEAIDNRDREEIFDALLDILVVTVGAMHSLGVDPEGGWNEVIRSNMSKIDPTTGKVIKREDGKVLKPEGFSPPDLSGFINSGP